VRNDHGYRRVGHLSERLLASPSGLLAARWEASDVSGSLECMTSRTNDSHVDSPGTAASHALALTARTGWWSRIAPVLLLLVTAPLVAEFLLGDVTLASLPALVLFIPLYGGGALLIREAVRRRGGGWPAIVVLAAAFGVVEEGLATQSLFNPDYAHQHLLSSGYVPALGIAIPWTVYVLSLHVIWSICTPIALVECMFPNRRTEPWLRTPGLIIITVVYVLGVVAAFATTWVVYRYVAPPSRLIGAAVVTVVLIIAGLLLTRVRRPDRAAVEASRPAPAAWVVGIAAAVAASLVVLTPHLPTALWRTLTILVIEAAAVIMITLWSGRPGWGDRQILALAAGSLFAYAWHAFANTPAFDSAPILIVRISNVVFTALAIVAVWVAARRIAAAA
jgi:hypothetical protein